MNAFLSAAAGLAISTTCFAQPAPAKAKPAGAQATNPAKAPDLKDPTLYVVGYAHLDTQWRWTYQDTIREFIPNTLTDNFKLFEKYPSYVFNFSGSRRYKMMQEYYPDDYKKLKAYVAAGKWFPCGSSVDENDANVPSAESLVRHVLYGNRFFRQEFGVASEEYMLPDCFGFPAALPSVLAHCGVKGFSTQKLTWNAVVPIPFKVGVWNGPDGRGVIAALDPGAYVGDVKTNLANDQTWLDRIVKNGKESGTYVDYHYFGTGDQGGAPHDATVAMVEQSVNTKGPTKVISAPADAMMKAISPDMRAKLPKYQGELELTEHSAGSISSEAYMKRWNRKNELLANAAESASVAAWWMGGRDYPTQRLEDAWYLLLGSQMHDILPGTSVPRAYDFSWNDECIAANQFCGILNDAASSVISGMDTRASKGTTIVVYNPLSFEREDVVEVEIPGAVPASSSVTATGPDGKAVPAQILAPIPGGVRVGFLAKVPSVGFAAYSVDLAAAEPAKNAQLKVSDHELENDSYIVKLDMKGDVSSIFDKQAKKELLSEPARIGLFYENPANWPAWNQDWADRQKPAKSFVGAMGPVTFKVVENGPARIAVEVTREAEGSTFTQTIRLSSGGASHRVEFDTDIDWRTRERSVRAAFPLTVSNPLATYDIQTGALQRGNGHDKQFEYSFHQWFDLSDEKGSYGVTVMCESKYASDKPNDNTVRLTLLHTPGTRGGYPDQGSQDLGRHHILYAIEGHSGTWQKEHTYTQAQQVNQPLAAFRAASHDGPLGKTFTLATSSDPAVTISAIKKAEDGDEVIVRLREQTGSPAKNVQIALGGKSIVSAREVDGQEREIAKAKVEGGHLIAEVGAFELRAFALKLADAPTKLAKIESKPVTLAYDADVVAGRANRTDGAMDDQGNAFPAEQFPATLTDGSVTFTFGKSEAGQKNAVNCQGQEVALPAGNWDKVYILAAATGDVSASLDIDGKPAPFAAQGWTGYVGQWDHRLWPGDSTNPRYSWNQDIIGLEPGFVKPASIAWFCSHHSTKSEDAIYQYSYIFKYAFDLPKGAKQIRLPNDSKIKVFAASVAKTGPASSQAAPLFDTLADHVQDPPRFWPRSGTFTDATPVRIEPTLYWKKGAIHYTTDGTDPTTQSPIYAAPITLSAPTTLKAAVVDASGKLGPVATTKLDINDTTPPQASKAIGSFQSPTVKVLFTEPLDPKSLTPSSFSLEPSIAITAATVADGSGIILQLASAPELNKPYKLKISGIKDTSPAHNTMSPTSLDLLVPGPVYSIDPTAAQFNEPIKVAGLPAKAKDPFTINMFVKPDKPVAPRTAIAGFGKCTQDQANGGQGRYISRFPGGLHFWAHNADAPSRTPIDQDKWQMLSATYDGQTLRLYKNGEKVGERAIALSDDESTVYIAPKDPWDHERQFSGEIKGFTIWSAALSDDALKGLTSQMPK